MAQLEAVAFQHPTSPTSNDGSVTVQVFNPDPQDNYQFSFASDIPEWLNPNPLDSRTYTFSGLGPGTHTFAARSADGMTVGESAPTTLTAQGEGEDEGPQHPADGAWLRNDCNGYNRQEVLEDGSGGERWGTVLEYNSTACGYVPEEEEPEPEPEDPTSYSVTITIPVQPCRPGVLVRWLNSLGGVGSWLFSGRKNRPFAVEAEGEFLLPDGLRSAVQKRGTRSLLVRTSGLNLNQYEALQEIFTSPNVWIEDGETVRQVYVVPGSVDTDPFRNSYELAVELQFAPGNQLAN